MKTGIPVYLINGIRYMSIRKETFHQLIPIETDLLLLSSPPLCRDTVVQASLPQVFQLNSCHCAMLQTRTGTVTRAKMRGCIEQIEPSGLQSRKDPRTSI